MIKSEKGNFYVKNTAGNLSIETVMETEQYAEKVKASTKSKTIKMSIEKWKFILDLLSLGLDVTREGGRFTCALCVRYDPWSCDCEGCPVSEYTHRMSCAGSPYTVFHAATSMDVRMQAAQDEIDFLKKLYDKAKSEE